MSYDINEEETQFPDFGDGGDLAGAKRLRHSFKLCVLAMVLLTFGMFVSEKVVRFGQAETLYINGITMTDKASGRVNIIAAIKADAEANETQTAKYTQALAVRQEDDIILRTYKEALAIDDKNALFTIRHGSRLFILGDHQEALREYRKAEVLLEGAKPNALPGYLQAAAIAQNRNDPGAIKQAMIAVVKANNLRDGNIIFPVPLWNAAYPVHGIQYARLQREIIDETCAPLMTLTTYAVKSIDDKIAKGQVDDALTWIGYLQVMGERLLNQSVPQGTIQASEGIRVLLECNKLTQKIEKAQDGAVSKATLEQSIKLESFSDALWLFEKGRDKLVDQEIAHSLRPNFLAFGTWVILMMVWFSAWCLCRLTKVRHGVWTLGYNGFTKLSLMSGCGAFFVLLVCFYSLNSLEGIPDEYVSILTWGWLAVGVIALLIGLISPLTMLVSPDAATRKHMLPEKVDAVIPYARVAYRQAYIALVLRYNGALSGWYTIMLCAWFLLHHLIEGLFPWQINVLADGFLDQEIVLVVELLNTL